MSDVPSVTCLSYEPEDFDHLVERWERRIALCRCGDLEWAQLVARKPRSSLESRA